MHRRDPQASLNRFWRELEASTDPIAKQQILESILEAFLDIYAIGYRDGRAHTPDAGETFSALRRQRSLNPRR
jgi:hypothetical protein